MAGAWRPWTRLELGSGFDELGPIEAVTRNDGRVETLVSDPDGGRKTYRAIWSADSSTPLSAPVLWTELGMRQLKLLLRYETGTLDAFLVSDSGILMHRRQPDQHDWPDPWDELSVMIAEPVVSVEPANGVAVRVPPAGGEPERAFPVFAFVITETGRIVQLCETWPDEVWGQQELYSPANRLRSLVAATRDDHRIELVGVSPDNRIWRTYQTAPGGNWSGQWEKLYTDQNRLRSVGAGVNAVGRLEVFGVGPDHRLWHTWELEPGGGWLGRWVEMALPGAPVGRLQVLRRDDRRLSVVAYADDLSRAWHLWQTTDDGHWNGGWVGTPEFDGELGVLTAAIQGDGVPEVYAADRHGGLWRSQFR